MAELPSLHFSAEKRSDQCNVAGCEETYHCSFTFVVVLPVKERGVVGVNDRTLDAKLCSGHHHVYAPVIGQRIEDWQFSIAIDNDYEPKGQPMQLGGYQKNRVSTGGPIPGHGTALGIVYCGLAIGGEGGEVADECKKMWRDDKLEITSERKDKIVKELGDVLWYMAEMCDQLGITLEDVANANIEKLTERRAQKEAIG